MILLGVPAQPILNNCVRSRSCLDDRPSSGHQVARWQHQKAVQYCRVIDILLSVYITMFRRGIARNLQCVTLVTDSVLHLLSTLRQRTRYYLPAWTLNNARKKRSHRRVRELSDCAARYRVIVHGSHGHNQEVLGARSTS